MHTSTPHYEIREHMQRDNVMHYALFKDGALQFQALTAPELRELGLGRLLPDPQRGLTILWQSHAYSSEKVVMRFLKCSCTLDSFIWHECAEGGETLREGIVDWREVPGDILYAAKQCAGTRFGYVVWPISVS